MPPLRIPDLPRLDTRGRILLLALGVTVALAVILGLRDGPGMKWGYGDTDDAMRLVLARQLLHGRGWWDQHEMILQPPLGLYMHWSRLLDGGIALMERLFALALSWPDAETATRFTWPLMWIFPAAVSVLLIARRFAEPVGTRDPGTGRAWPLWIAAAMLVVDLPLYAQFHPGRVDHHDVQMTMFFLSVAGAIQRRDSRWGAILAGAASGIGLAIGLEALVFEAAIGAVMALRFVLDGAEGRRLWRYGISLAVSTALSFGVQTPPVRWSVSGCDALELNLVTALCVAGVGLALVGRLATRRAWTARLGGAAVVGAAAAAAYLALDPNCVHGPFADVDPRIKPFWLNYVQEVAPFPRLLARHPEEAIWAATSCLLGLLAWAWLGRRRAGRTLDWALLGVLLLLTTAAGFVMVRAAGYAEWLAVPVSAVAAAEIALRYRRFGVLAPALAAMAVAPITVAGVAMAARNTAIATADRLHPSKAAKPAAKPPADYCFNPTSYRVLAEARPVGLVVGDIDFGPFVLIHTPHSTLSAPYHRMNWGIMAARGILSADADDPGPTGAEARARALHVAYVLECKVHRVNADRAGLSPDSLQAELDRDDWPDWLQLISPETDPVRVYRVLSPAEADAP